MFCEALSLIHIAQSYQQPQTSEISMTGKFCTYNSTIVKGLSL